ncbi:MAG TPA: DUF1194 domain-containing protein [Geminicoccaceae bacterium]|nr:DUF1194 domain-containing protein [Geminicoccus sp.]HMU52589.1 DUF1194 domain-containing protein [Geminicoccaceae bacterium]
MLAASVRSFGVAVLALAAPVAPASAMDTPVDLELVLAVDVSGSMDIEEQQIQRAGYIEAITHPEVLSAIRTGPYGRIALAYVEWGGSGYQTTTIPWRTVEDDDSARQFAAALAEAPIARIRGTSISGALSYSSALFEGNGYEGFRRVIDISGDGPNNMGMPVLPVRDEVLQQGIVINGLPVMLRPSGGYLGINNLDVYYEDCVVGGPGSFVVSVNDPAQFPETIRRKLVLEIAGLPATVHKAQLAQRAPRIDCLIGEGLRQRWDLYER